jgi:hypothetical protein
MSGRREKLGAMSMFSEEGELRQELAQKMMRELLAKTMKNQE